MTYYGHTREGEPPSQWQPLAEHLNSVGDLSRGFAERFGAAIWGELAGRWHDVGKYSEEFQAHIGNPDATTRDPGRVDHSTAGAQLSLKLLGDQWGLPVAYCIAGHHGGLPDWLNDGDSGLKYRLRKSVADWHPDSHLSGDAIDARSLTFPFVPSPATIGMQVFLFTQMLFSALVDADFLDTEHFVDPVAAERRGIRHDLAELERRLDAHIETLTRDAPDTAVKRARSAVLDDSRLAADRDPGLFSLTVPTGGGKTLSSMAFALRHAVKHGMDRVIYVIPYTTIIEQNAAVFRSVFDADDGRPSVILEHHSNYQADTDRGEDDRWSRLASENWDAPIIVTTNVQFFESIFSNRVSKSRRVHRIANSVVVLDEAQMLPPDLLRPTLSAIQELSDTYRTTFVLCTATQPAVSYRPEFPDGLQPVREIASDVPTLFETLRRTNVEHIGEQAETDLVARISNEASALVVVNTKARARSLFDACRREGFEHVYHLSTSMYPRHRSRVLEKIRARLEAKQPVRVISTQLIEAGVDVDFPVVFREEAGLDSVAQAAGRCNREGSMAALGKVFVYGSPDGVPRQFRTAVAAAKEAVQGGDDIVAPKSILRYFSGYYWRRDIVGGIDRNGISRDMLGQQNGCRIHIPFQQIGDAYKLIREASDPVIVANGCLPEDRDAIAAALDDLRYAEVGRSALRRLQQYAITVYDYELRTLSTASAVEEVRIGLWSLLNGNAYSEDVGLRIENAEVLAPESLVQ